MILLLHTVIEAVVGFLFLFYPEAGDLVPGFGTSEGPSFELLMKMYGLSALFLAGLSLYAYFRRLHTRIFLLAIFLTGQFLGRRKQDWAMDPARHN
jgi:hypothetical protein